MCRNKGKHEVRLSEKEVKIIRNTVDELLGNAATIRIFGSRALENEKGGDIDILIETTQTLPDRIKSACRLVSELQMQLGDQKIDIIIIDSATREQPIHQIARQTGVLL